jgi:hypothetical protein
LVAPLKLQCPQTANYACDGDGNLVVLSWTDPPSPFTGTLGTGMIMFAHLYCDLTVLFVVFNFPSAPKKAIGQLSTLVRLVIKNTDIKGTINASVRLFPT